MSGCDVLLASLPLSSARYPSLALGLLKPAIQQIGIGCDVRYFSLDYIDAIGTKAFACLNDMQYYTALVGEWVFAAAARDADANCSENNIEDLHYISDVFMPKCPAREMAARIVAVLAARRGAEDFIERCVNSVDWNRYGMLGVSTSFQQNMASLAFAKRVKARHPDVFVVFGGANCQGEMGVELHRRYPFVDAVCLGEGDRTFPELIGCHLSGKAPPDLPGFVLRSQDGTTRLPARPVDQIENLDTLPYPDLSDFYDQRAALASPPQGEPVSIFETARGCWWGAKHHCTFCGLNGRMMSYRSKSQRRAYDELNYIVGRYGSHVVTSDAILDLHYFDEFLPRLAAEGPDVSMFWQMKANLRPEQLALLSRAGIKRIQPGIEALDTELLKLMKKGCTMLQNVQTLKIAAENGLSVAWNLLYGFPGENPAAYERATRLMPKLRHLQPPATTGRVLADRFSPYFQHPELFGVRLEPAAAYFFIYPFDEAGVREFAYHFHMHSDALDHINEIVAPMRTEQRLWCDHHKDSAFYYNDMGEILSVTDERWSWPQLTLQIQGAAAALLRLCWQITCWNDLRAELAPQFSDADLHTAMEQLLEFDIVIQEGPEFLALPLRQPGWRRAPTWGEIIDAAPSRQRSCRRKADGLADG